MQAKRANHPLILPTVERETLRRSNPEIRSGGNLIADPGSRGSVCIPADGNCLF